MSRSHALLIRCVLPMFVLFLSVLIVWPLPGLAADDEGSTPWRGQLLYGWDIMTGEERKAFREEMRTYRTYPEQLAFWRRHTAAITQRAWDRGLPIDEPPEVMPPFELQRLRRPIFGIGLLTGAEIESYRAVEGAMVARGHTPEEYEAFLAEHEKLVRQRAWDRGWEIDPKDEEQEKARKKKAEKAAKNRNIMREAILKKLEADAAAE